MKKVYDTPVVEIKTFNNADIITTSGGLVSGGTGFGGDIKPGNGDNVINF